MVCVVALLPEHDSVWENLASGLSLGKETPVFQNMDIWHDAPLFSTVYR